jgi:hypothetical protein
MKLPPIGDLEADILCPSMQKINAKSSHGKVLDFSYGNFGGGRLTMQAHPDGDHVVAGVTKDKDGNEVLQYRRMTKREREKLDKAEGKEKKDEAAEGRQLRRGVVRKGTHTSE